MGGSTPLHQAAMHGHTNVVQSLLAYGADANARTADGDSPLMCAASDGHAEVVKLLLAHGADTSAKNKGRTALEAAMYWKKQEVINILLDHQAVAEGKSLSRLQSWPRGARPSEARAGPIFRSCSDSKAEQDRCPPTCMHESPRKAGQSIQAPAPACSHMPAKAQGSESEYSSGKQAGRASHMGNAQYQSKACTSEPDTPTRSEGNAIRCAGRATSFKAKAGRSEGKAKSFEGTATSYEGKLARPEGKAKSFEGTATSFEGKPARPEGNATRCEGRATRPEGKATCFEGKATGFEGKATRSDSKATRPEGKASRCEGTAEEACAAEPNSAVSAEWEKLGAQLAPGTYGFYSTEASAIVEDGSLGWANILWEVFQQFSAVGQELAASAGFVPGLYLVAVGLKLIGYVMRSNASADDLTQRLYRLACSIVRWLDSLLPKAAQDDSVLLRVEKLLTPLAFVLRDVKSFIEEQPGAWALGRLFTGGSRQAAAHALQDKLEEFLKELQLAGFVVNLDTREQVQKLQREVRQCTDGLASLQHHLTTGFAEVKDKIAEVNDSQDRMQAQLGRVLQEVQLVGLRLDPKTEAKSQELMHEAGHMDPVQQQKLLATVLWEAQEALDKHAATRHHAEVLQRTAEDNGWDRCGICCEALALEGDMKPRFLPCQHVLCSSCIVQCCSDGLVTCPWCREVHRPKFLVAVDGDITCAADGFPLPLMQMQYLENRVKYGRGLQA
ncbi:hypothetical protein ABBQ38_008978 [Trebouxia sp. C0009 RCD-2024]